MIIKKQNRVFISKASIAKAKFKGHNEQKLFENKLDSVSKEEDLFIQKNVKVYFSVRNSLP